MYIKAALITDILAQEVVNALGFFLRHYATDKYFLLECNNAGGSSPRSVWLRPILEQQLDELVDTSQIVQCITDDGKRVDILLPQRDLRGLMSAGVLFEKEEVIRLP